MSGSEIRRIRGALGLNQTQFAALFNVHPGTVSRWENEAAEPDAWQHSILSNLKTSARRVEDRSIDKLPGLLAAGAVGVALGLLLAAVLRDEDEETG